jgi:hypothetical protein
MQKFGSNHAVCKIGLMCLFLGWLRVYYGLDLLLNKLSKALSSGKFP